MNTLTRSQRISLRAGTLGALMSLLVANGRWWLVPLVVVFAFTSVLLSVVAAIEYFAPFVYSLF
jgi:hypothetical protein